MAARAELSADQVNRLKDLFDEALDTPSGARSTFVAEACSGDTVLESELESLLEAHDRSSGYFEKLADEVIAAAVSTIERNDRDEWPAAGRIILHYELLERIGGGGMGVVYKARDTRLNRVVALKFLPHRHASNPAARARLLAEARAASAPDNENIGVVYEIAEAQDGRPFIAMAWYDGETLKARARRDPMLPAEVVAIGRQLCNALSAAHAAGIVHCDVKPANVIVTRSGVAKLVDFGIAKLLSEDDAGIQDTAGTIGYMSPEQIRGHAVDARTDLWSLGVVLYETLTGRRPFRGDTDADVIRSIQTAEPGSISLFRGDVPASLCKVIERCLRKDAKDRFQSADDIAEALRSIEIRHSHGEVEAPAGEPAKGPRSYRYALFAIPVALFAAAVWAGSDYTRRSSGVGAVVSEPVTVAIIPFANRDSVAADEHLVSGFTDEVIGTLGSAPGLRVIARASSAALARQGLSPIAIGRRLGASAIVHGDVARVGQRLRLSVQLTSVADSSAIWSGDYNRPVTEAFTVQQEVSESIVRALARPGVRTGPALPARQPTNDSDAYEMYLKGRLSWSQRTEAGLEQALAYFGGALDRDPGFALAHAGVAAAYHNMSNFGYMAPEVALARADVASRRAITLDSSSVDAAATRGYVLASLRRYAESEAEFERAIRLNPRYSWTHHYYALLLMMLGRNDEATRQIRSALALDPLSQPANATLGILLAMRGMHAQSRAQYEHAMSMAPGFALTRQYFGALVASEGRYDEAIELLEPAVKSAPDFPGIRATLAFAYARAGRASDARSAFDELRSSVKDERSRLNLALGQALMGNPDTAFAMLEKARWDAPTLIELRANPLLDGFRADPRYRLLLSKHGLKP